MTAPAPTPWHTQSWFTSPWNHEAGVAGQHKRLLTQDEFTAISRAVTGGQD